nr:hypothetical protein B0A51_11920 [Rachicladosporium sp. CCFEE 5018]
MGDVTDALLHGTSSRLNSMLGVNGFDPTSTRLHTGPLPLHTYPGPDVNDKITTLSVYTPSTLHFWSHTAAWTEMMNLAFFTSHSSTKTMPGEVARFQTETQFINELGSQEGTFIAVLAFDQPDGELYDGIIGTAAAKRYAPPTGALPPKSQQGETFSRSTESFATFEGAELWELRHMGVRPDLQGRGLAGYLMKLCEEEVQRLFDARKAKGEVVDGMGLVMLLTTLKEINETFYAKRGWKWDEEKKFGKGWMGSEAGFSVAHMSKRLVQ